MNMSRRIICTGFLVVIFATSGGGVVQNNNNVDTIDVNMLASAIVIAMKVDDENSNQKWKTNAVNLADTVVRALRVDTKRTNTLLRATSTIVFPHYYHRFIDNILL